MYPAHLLPKLGIGIASGVRDSPSPRAQSFYLLATCECKKFKQILPYSVQSRTLTYTISKKMYMPFAFAFVFGLCVTALIALRCQVFDSKAFFHGPRHESNVCSLWVRDTDLNRTYERSERLLAAACQLCVLVCLCGGLSAIHMQGKKCLCLQFAIQKSYYFSYLLIALTYRSWWTFYTYC